MASFGAIFLLSGFAVVTSISDNDERAKAAVAFVLGILGIVFICASGE